MFNKLQYEPTTNPINPKRIIRISFKRIQLLKPCFSEEKVIISINGGKINASAELLNAPTSEMTAPRFGMATAITNVMKTRNVLVTYSAISQDFSVWNFFSMKGQMMLNGT